jgi:hypothetical protein
LYILDELEQMPAMYDRINRELRAQYLLGYYATPVPPPGSYRHVELKVKGSDTVHYRKGYFTASSQ